MNNIVRYPRTRHVETSGLQGGDEDLEIVPFSQLVDKHLVVEEKIDGCNVGVSFDSDCRLWLQSRGHFLIGNDKPHFNLFKAWANSHENEFFDLLMDRYILYAEWMQVLHSVYYDLLPDFFMEFDVWDKQQKVFLDTPTRYAMLAKLLPFRISSVKVLHAGKVDSLSTLTAMVGKSHFISQNAFYDLIDAMDKAEFTEAEKKAISDMNKDGLMEGLYIKWEEDGIVKGRYKWVRGNFVQGIKESNQHWAERRPVYNKVKP